jgi:hypothetical protein
VDHPLVRVAAIGPSRRGHDLVVYLASAAPDPVTVALRVPGTRAAFVGTSLERSLSAVSVEDGAASVPVPAGGFVAVSIDKGQS